MITMHRGPTCRAEQQTPIYLIYIVLQRQSRLRRNFLRNSLDNLLFRDGALNLYYAGRDFARAEIVPCSTIYMMLVTQQPIV